MLIQFVHFHTKSFLIVLAPRLPYYALFLLFSLFPFSPLFSTVMVTLITSESTTTTITSKKKPIATEDDIPQQQKRHVRQPEVCVDYLSYNFDEMDLAASWRVMTQQKKQVVDGIRLENASWRTWAKQRNNLKTIHPQSLNWLKDSDVTWLYGPLHTVIKVEEDPFMNTQRTTTEQQLGLITSSRSSHDKNDKKPLKSALKKVSTVDLLKRSIGDIYSAPTTASADKKTNHPNSSLPPPSPPSPPPATATATAVLTSTVSMRQHRKNSISDMNKKLQAVSPAILATHRQPRLSFNHRVEQCIAIVNEEEEGVDDMDRETRDEDEDILSSDLHYASTSSYQHHSFDRTRRKSILKIRSTRLKRSQSDDDEACSSLSSSAATSNSSLHYITHSPLRSYEASPSSLQQQQLKSQHDVGTEFEEEEEDDDDDDQEIEEQADKNRYSSVVPAAAISTTNVSLKPNYKEKSNIAEPALVTMHQTARDIHKKPEDAVTIRIV
ncbi:hypothetical protein BDF20DRAFT_856494 [Mycotypha africana]|uniref:uncharacterized protein n=1 Tax=Mycotypha africana TaxID=64632 RepID=UPI0023001E2A|nr:uncharacterized protein BDF20DRAFT_856494 [Mycotypha africana]KAI8988571.1 hypothetical protein BDF20DRAFT_856494 [Mycotypha africana]